MRVNFRFCCRRTLCTPSWLFALAMAALFIIMMNKETISKVTLFNGSATWHDTSRYESDLNNRITQSIPEKKLYMDSNISVSGSISAPAEVKHVMFLKVHKTGSSTAQNIFLRFGVIRNLTFILGTIQDNECGGWSNCISYINTLTDKNIWPPPVNKGFDILCNHVLYNREVFQKYLPLDTVNIGSVREPVSRLASAINFFHLLEDVNLTTYANDPIRYNHMMLNNRMAKEFGFDQKLFPNTTHKTLTEIENREAVAYVNQLNDDFSLIIVMEMFNESIVLMKRMLNWEIKDMFYVVMGKRKHRKFQTNDAIKLKKFLYLDYMLYDFAVKRLENKISMLGQDFKDEVMDFVRLNGKVNKFCQSRKQKPKALIIEASKWYDQFVVNWNVCTMLKRSENRFIKDIRKRQYPTRKIIYDKPSADNELNLMKNKPHK